LSTAKRSSSRRNQGISLSQIADEFGVSKGSVYNIVNAASA
jgi:transposase